MARKWKYHKVKDVTIEGSRKKKEGNVERPKKNDALQIICNVKASFEENDENIKKCFSGKGSSSWQLTTIK